MMPENPQTVKDRLEVQKRSREENMTDNAPACAVLAGGLEPERSGGRPMTPLGFQSKLTCTPEPGRAPVQYMLAHKHSANHAHSRGKLHKRFILFGFFHMEL